MKSNQRGPKFWSRAGKWTSKNNSMNADTSRSHVPIVVRNYATSIPLPTVYSFSTVIILFSVNYTTLMIDFYSAPPGDPTAPDMSGWRARLAKQGYVASTVRKKTAVVPERQWQYMEENESEEFQDGFEYRTNRGTWDESQEQLDSVISRTKRIKLQKMNEVPRTSEMEVQVSIFYHIRSHNPFHFLEGPSTYKTLLQTLKFSTFASLFLSLIRFFISLTQI